MKAYKNIRFIEEPDIEDIQSQGRKSSVGRLKRGETQTKFVDGIVTYPDGTPGRTITKGVHNDRGYGSPKSKAKVRRNLKRIDRSIETKFNEEAEK